MEFSDVFPILLIVAASLAIWGKISDHNRRRDENHKIWDAIQALNERLDSK